MAELRRGLGFLPLLALATTSIIGTGTFFGQSIAAGIAGTASLVSWVLVALLSLYIAFCFAELSSLYPRAGGVYEYAKQAYGRQWSFFTGWTAWLVGTMTTTMLVVAAVEYLTPTGFPLLPKLLISAMFVLLLYVIAYLGAEASSMAVNFFVVVTFVVLGLMLVPGGLRFHASNLHPFWTSGFRSIFLAMFFLIETFFGWESVTYLSEETTDARAVPRAIIWGTVLVAVLNIALVLVLFGLFPSDLLATMGTPLLEAGELLLGHYGQAILGLGVYLVLIGSAAGGIIGGPRLLMAMARDHLVFPSFARVHEKFRTPYLAVIFQCIVSLAVIFFGFGSYRVMLSLLVPMAAVMYVLVLIAVPVLRRKDARRREFPAPFGMIGPIVAALVLLALVGSWAWTSYRLFLMALSLVLAGIPVYYLFALTNDSSTIRTVSDRAAPLTLLFERFTLPENARRTILGLLGDVSGKKVLEYGCGVGTVTQLLADAVGEHGAVYATNASAREIAVADRRMHGNVRFIHDDLHHSRVSSKVPNVDVVVSVGQLGYVQDLPAVLRGVNKRLDMHERILFMDFDKYFGVLPNVAWLGDDLHIKRTFEDAGFHVGVVRKKGLFWQYVYVYGVKYKEA